MHDLEHHLRCNPPKSKFPMEEDTPAIYGVGCPSNLVLLAEYEVQFLWCNISNGYFSLVVLHLSSLILKVLSVKPFQILYWDFK